jgi:hypothetical protein
MIKRTGWATALLCAAILTFPTAVPADAAAPRSNQIDVAYEPPKSSAHDTLYKVVQERRVLERMRDLLAPLRLPRRVLLKAVGCDGEINAWYDDGAIAVCYEFLEWVWQSAPQETTPAGAAPIDGLRGPVIQIVFHEAGHAVFDLLKVPIFGREEDDADQFAAYLMLQAGKDEVRRLIGGAAYGFKNGVQSESQNIATKRFADVHGTLAQRFFYILCLAYGADNKLFKDIVANGYLAKERAEGCDDEYAQVAHAFKTLIGPYIDRKLAAKMHKNWLPPVNSPIPRRPPGSNPPTAP